MKLFTVIGYYPETMQRFCERYNAYSAMHAEELCVEGHPEVAICGTLPGWHDCVDEETLVTNGGDECA